MNDTLPQLQLIQISVEENLTNQGHVYLVIAHAHYSKSPTYCDESVLSNSSAQGIRKNERVKFWLILWFCEPQTDSFKRVDSKKIVNESHISVWSDKWFHLFENNIIKSFSFSLTKTTTSWLICWPRSPLFFQHSSVIPFPTLSTDGQGKNWGLEKFRFHGNHSWKQLAERVSAQVFLHRSWRFARGFVVNPWQRKPYPLITAS